MLANDTISRASCSGRTPFRLNSTLEPSPASMMSCSSVFSMEMADPLACPSECPRAAWAELCRAVCHGDPPRSQRRSNAEERRRAGLRRLIAHEPIEHACRQGRSAGRQPNGRGTTRRRGFRPLALVRSGCAGYVGPVQASTGPAGVRDRLRLGCRTTGTAPRAAIAYGSRVPRMRIACADGTARRHRADAGDSSGPHPGRTGSDAGRVARRTVMDLERNPDVVDASARLRRGCRRAGGALSGRRIVDAAST